MPDGSTNQGVGGVGRGLEVLGEYQQAAGSLQAFREAAEKVERDPNMEIADKIRNLDGNADRMTQLDGISALTTAMVSMMAKLEKAGGDLELVKKNPDALPDQLMKKGLVAKLKLPERTALETLPLLIHQEGDTAGYLRTAWPEIVDQGLESSKGWTEKLKNQIKKDPVGTIGLMAIGVGVAWAGWSLISKLWKDKEAEKEGGTDGKKADTEEKKSSWLKAKILIPIGIMIAGGILGRGKLQKLLGSLGIDDLQKLLASGESIPEDIRKQIEEQKTKIEKLEEAAKEKAAGVKGAIEKGKEKVVEAGKTVKDTVEDPRTQFNTAKKLFIMMNFYDERMFEGKYKNNIDLVIRDLKGVNVQDLMNLYEKNKDKATIPEDEFPVDKHGVRPDHLFMIIAGIAEIKKIFYGEAPSNITVEALFIKSITDPVYKMNHAFHSSLIDKIKDGNLQDVLDGIDYGSIETELKEKGGEFVGELQPSSELYESLSKDEKLALREIQICLYESTNINSTPEKAVQIAIDDLPSNWKAASANEKVKDAAKEYFTILQNETTNLIPRIHERFGISEINKEKVENYVEKNITMDNLTTAHAIQLLVIAKTINWQEAEKGKIHWMKDLALLNVVLRAMDKTSRDLYIGQLSKIAWESDTFINIKLPSLANLMPYISKIAEYGKNKALDKGYGILYKGLAWARTRPTLEQIKEHPYVSFGSELGGGMVEIATDTLALLLATAHITPEQMGAVESAEDLFDLITTKGGQIVYERDKDGRIKSPGWIAFHMYGNYFFAKPLGALADSFGALLDGGPGNAVKTYLVGGATYAVIGALHGAFLNPVDTKFLPRVFGAVRGGLKGGFLYPYYAPKIGVQMIIKTTKGIAIGLSGAKEYAKRPGQFVGTAWRYAAEKIKYRDITRQSLGNLLRNMRDFKRFYIPSEFADPTKRDLIVEFFKNPLNTAKRLPGWFNEKMAIRYASRFGHNYHNFFHFTEAKLGNPLVTDPIRLIQSPSSLKDTMEAATRFEHFINRVTSPGATDFDEIREILKKNIKDEAKLLEIKDIFDKDLEKNEATALAKQVKNEKQLDKLISQIQTESAFLRKGEMPGPSAEAETATAEAETAAKAGEAEVAASKVTKISEGKYSYMGKEFAITEDEIAKKTVDLKFEKLKEVGVAKAGEVKVSTEEAIEALCKEKYIESVKIGEVRVTKTPEGVEVREYKVGDEWVKVSENPEELVKAKEEVVAELEKAGKTIDPKKLADSKVLKYFDVLQKVLGPSFAALVIYQLESANTIEEKEDAVVEMGFGFAAFEAGAKATAAGLTKVWKPSSVKAVMSQAVLSLLGGLAAAVGVQKPIESLIDEKFPLYVSKQKALGEMSAAFEKLFAKDISRALFKTLGKEIVEEKIKTGIGRKAIEKIGLKVLGSALDTKIKSTVLKKVAQFASKSLGKKVLAGIGVRGATIIALAADDASIIGILDDVVAAGLLVWTAVDVVQIVQLGRKAYKIKTEMEKASKLPIKEITPSTEVDKKTLADELEMRGKSLEAMNDKEIMDLITSISDINIKITREGKGGYEEYHFMKGEVLSTKIMDETGEIFELSDEELNQQIGQLNAKEFKPQDIDYNLPKDKLLANFRMALLHIKSECGWTKMDHEIIDENTISIKRLDGNQEMKITRSGDTWSVPNAKEGLDIYRAAALANLINKIKLVLEKEKYTGSPHPFEIEGGGIDFNKEGSPVDLAILSGDLEAIKFYRKIGFNTESLVKILNAWYEKTYYVV